MSLPSEPITAPAGTALVMLERGILAGAQGSCLGLLCDPASCSELTFLCPFGLDIGLLHIHIGRELGGQEGEQ